MSQVEYDVDQEDEEKDKDDEEKYVAVEDDEDRKDDVDGNADDEDDEEKEKKEDKRLSGDDEEDDAEKDYTRSRRKDENKGRRKRQREARDRTEREVNFLRTRNEALERRFSQLETEVDARVTGSERSAVDTQINKAKSDLQLANQVIEQAVEAQSGKDVAEALDHRDNIRDNLRDLEAAKEYLAEDRQPAAQPDLDPRHVAHAQAFMRDHDWWDPRGKDRDSQAVLRLDRSLVQEGYQPATKEYWDELRERVQTELPDHFDTHRDPEDYADDADADAKKGKKPRKKRETDGPEFRSAGRERPLKKNEVYISPERRTAMVEAGVWDDPVLRNRFLKAYATYDSENEGA